MSYCFKSLYIKTRVYHKFIPLYLLCLPCWHGTLVVYSETPELPMQLWVVCEWWQPEVKMWQRSHMNEYGSKTGRTRVHTPRQTLGFLCESSVSRSLWSVKYCLNIRSEVHLPFPLSYFTVSQWAHSFLLLLCEIDFMTQHHWNQRCMCVFFVCFCFLISWFENWKWRECTDLPAVMYCRVLDLSVCAY